MPSLNGSGNEPDFRRFVGPVSVIVGAAGCGQLLAVGAAPLVARLYQPEDFGHFAIFTAAVALVYPLASFRYEWGLLSAPDDDTARDLLGLAAILIAVSLMVLMLLVVGTSRFIRQWSELGGAELTLFPLAVAIFSLNGTAMNWLTRERAFSELASVRLATPLGMSAIQLGLGWFHPGPTALICGFVGGYLLGIAAGSRTFYHALARSIRRLTARGLRRVASEYRAFAIISAPASVLNVLGSQLPNLAFPALYGDAITGQYLLARRVLLQPRDLICQAVNQAFYRDAGLLFTQDPDRLWMMFVRLTAALLLATTPSVILIWYGPEIFSLLFGPPWAEAGRYAGVMVLANSLGMATQGTTILAVVRLNHWMGAWEAARLALVGSALLAAHWMALSPFQSIIALSVAFGVGEAALIGLNGLVLVRARRRACAATQLRGRVAPVEGAR
jgi:O-antigen/teichoic acid export membrane protein